MTDTIGTRVKMRRVQLNLTQMQLAEKSGMSQQAIQRIEQGDTKKSRSLPAIANALGVTVSFLENGSYDSIEKAVDTSRNVSVDEACKVAKESLEIAVSTILSMKTSKGQEPKLDWNTDKEILTTMLTSAMMGKLTGDYMKVIAIAIANSEHVVND